MESKPVDPERDLRELSEALDLPYEAQDWGIANADADRIEEFINHYERHVELGRTQRFEFGGLVLASANDALVVGNWESSGILQEFLERHGRDFPAHLEYWRSLDDPEEFPLSVWIREHFPSEKPT